METISRALAASAARCSQRSRDSYSSSAAEAGPRASGLPGTLPSSCTGQAPRGWDGAGTLAHTREPADRSPGLRLSTRPYPCISHPVGPASFLHFRQGPQEGRAALSLTTVNSNTQSGDSVQGQGRAALSYPQASPTGAHSGRCPLLDPQVCKDDEMHSVDSQSLPTNREDVKRTTLHSVPGAVLSPSRVGSQVNVKATQSRW